MNGLTEQTHAQLLQTVRDYQTSRAGALPRVDAAYNELFGDQIDRFTFRQAWQAVLLERQRSAAAASPAEVDAPAEGDQPPTVDAPVSDDPDSQTDA